MNLKYRYFCAWPIAYKLLNVSVLWHSTDRWVDLARAPVCFRTLLCTQRIVSDIHVSRMATQSQSLRFYWMLNSSVGHQDQPDRCLWIQATKPRLFYWVTDLSVSLADEWALYLGIHHRKCAHVVLFQSAVPAPTRLRSLSPSALEPAYTERPSYWPPGKGKTVAGPREQRWPSGRTGSFINDWSN